MSRQIIGLWHDGNFPREGNFTASWKLHNPEADIRLLSFAQAADIVLANRPALIPVYEKMEDVVTLSALLRYGLVDALGEVIYMDPDVECLRPFGDLFECDLLLCPQMDGRVCDTIIGCRNAGHLFWEKVLAPQPGDGETWASPEEAAIAWGSERLNRVASAHAMPYHSPTLLVEMPGVSGAAYTAHRSMRRWYGKKIPRVK